MSSDKEHIDLANDSTWWEFHAKEAMHAEKGFWYDCPVRCPSLEIDALSAIKQLHQELQSWLSDEKSIPPDAVEFWDAETARSKGHVYGDQPLAQIAWLAKNKGKKDWPALLLQGRSFNAAVFNHEGKRYFFEPSDSYVLSMTSLDRA